MDISFPNLNNEREVRRLLQLDKPFYTVDKIRLPYKNNSLTIRFATLSYEDPLRNRYAYILNGVDKEWINNSSNNTASYTNLPPGEYEFWFVVRIMTIIGMKRQFLYGLWLLLPGGGLLLLMSYMHCCYLPSSYFLVGVGICMSGVSINVGWRSIRLPKKKKCINRKSIFINLVHEIRTPLSLIRLPLEKLREEEIKGKENKYISVIEKNVDYLLGIINQLLDFQKLEVVLCS